MIEKIAQLVDSAGNLPREILQKYQIREIPFYYTFDRKTYLRENIDHDAVDFYRYMQQYPDRVPLTAAPNVNDWMEAFEEVYRQGYRKMIVTTISSELSASFQNASIARKTYLSLIKDVEIELMTSTSCTCGQAALEIKIAQMINETQLSWEDICIRAKASINGLTTFFTVKSLMYMKAGGRIGGATAFMGKLINIKPVCEFVNGVVRPVKAVRGNKKALLTMVDECYLRMKHVSNPIICTQNALCEEDESFIIDYLRSKFDCYVPVYRGMLGAVVGTHSGPGSIGIGYVGGI